MPRKAKTAAEVLSRFAPRAPRQPQPEPPDPVPVRIEVQPEVAPILEPPKAVVEAVAQVESARPGKRHKAKRGMATVVGGDLLRAGARAVEKAKREAKAERELFTQPVEPADGTPVADKISSLHLLVDMVGLAQEHYRQFPDFLVDLWQHVIPGAPKPTAIQKDIAEYLQHGPQRRMILGFRGVAKSYIFGAYFMWRLLHDPEERMKYLSGDEDKVIQFSNWTKSLRELPHFPVLRHLRSRKDQKDDQYLWDVGPASLQQYNTFMGAPATSAISGGRCTIGGLDDCEQNSNSDSELKRSKLLRNALDVSNMLIPESRQDMVVLGTYKSLNSIYITLARERGYDVMFIPCLVPPRAKDYRDRLAPTIAKMAEDKSKVGQSVEPTRWTAADLKIHEKEKGPLQFQLEWMVSDQHGDRYEYPFPLDRLIVWDGVNPHGAPTRIIPGTSGRERLNDLPCVGLPGDGFYRPNSVDYIARIPGERGMVPYGTVLMSVDPSGSGDHDEAAYAILGAVPGQIHLIDWDGRKNGVDPKTMKMLALAAKKWGVREVVYESNMEAWGSLFEQTMKEAGVFCRIEGVRSIKNKEGRIAATLEPILYGANLIVSHKAIQDEYDRGLRSGDQRWQERLLQYQIAHFRRSIRGGGLEYDDRVDALSIGLAHLHERFLKTGTGAAAEAERQRLEFEDDDSWHEAHFGERLEEPLWVKVRR